MALNSVNNLLNFLETEEDDQNVCQSNNAVEVDRSFSLDFASVTSSNVPANGQPVRHVRIQPSTTKGGKEGRRESVSSSSSGSILEALNIPTYPHSKVEVLSSLPRTRIKRAPDEFVGVGFPSFQSPKRTPLPRNTYRSPQIMPLTRKDTKFVLVTGGVISGLGKGITASSIGLLLKLCGIRVTAIKIDPYLNIDAGTMSPYEHGEVFVLDDGGECDLDLGNYERFLDVTLTRDHNITTGKVYQNVLSRERQGEYLGKTVQVVPHVTDEIQNWISRVSRECVDGSGEMPEVCMIELGGTVGDIESSVYLEALRQFIFRVGRDNVFHIHVSLVTVVGAVGEQKSKPTQHSVRSLRATGLIPNMIVCRSSEPVSESIRQKVSLFSMVPESHVISVHDVNNIYQVPRMLLHQEVVQMVLNGLHLKTKRKLRLDFWDDLSSKAMDSTERVTIGLVGKYTGLSDSYLSVTKALSVSALLCDRKLKIVWIESAHLEKSGVVDSEQNVAAWEKLRSVDGILIPGGFGDRGIEGKIRAAQYARESKTPFLGICLGMQCAVIEYARNELGMVGANSSEFDDTTEFPVVKLMLEHNPNNTKGGTMRLGSRVADVVPQSLAHLLYGETTVHERHRHRYEVNPDLLNRFEEGRLIFSARDSIADPVRMEMIELNEEDHPFYFGTQFHPEFKSRPNRVSPPFLGLVKAAARILDRQELRAQISA